MRYDDASWHYGGRGFPPDQPQSAAGVHIAFYVAWAVLRQMAGEVFEEDADLLSRFRDRLLPPDEMYRVWCDEKFATQDLNPEAAAFTSQYYASEDGRTLSPGYFDDYETTFSHYASIYEVVCSWANFDMIADVIDRRFSDWRKGIRK